MAIKEWIGTDSGNEGDWATAANWSPSGVPVNGDDVRLTGGSQDVTAGLNQSAVTLDSLHIRDGYTGSIGPGASDVLQINVNGPLRFDGRGARNSIDGTIAELQVFGGTSSDDMLIIDGNVTLAHLVGGTGRVTFSDSMTLNNVRVGRMRSGELLIGSSITGLASLVADAGEITVRSSITNVRLGEDCSCLIDAGSSAFELIEMMGRANLRHLSDGTIDALRLFGSGATFDGRENAATAVTITLAELYPGGVIDVRNALDSYTITTLKLLGGDYRAWTTIS